MGNIPANPSPGNKPDGDDPLSALISSNVDALLAEAESLASDVARQLGSEPAGASVTSGPKAGAGQPEQTGVSEPDAAEAALAEMEALAASVRGPSSAGEAAPPESGVAAGAAAGPKRDDPGASAVAPPSAEVQDVQAQTAAGDPAALAKELDAEIAAAADLADGLAPSGAPSPTAVAPPTGRAEEVPAPAPASPAARVSRRIRVPGFVRAAPRAVLTAPAWAVVGICRLVDLPFGWMSPSLKEKLGYIGMVTAIMAAVAWAVAALGPGR